MNQTAWIGYKCDEMPRVAQRDIDRVLSVSLSVPIVSWVVSWDCHILDSNIDRNIIQNRAADTCTVMSRCALFFEQSQRL